MLKLSELARLKKAPKRVGRGGAHGGTSGKGHKGQKARSGGYVRRGFEGGQTPLYRRLPKRGFNNAVFRREYAIVALEQLDRIFKDGDVVDLAALIAHDLVRSGTDRVKILGGAELAKNLTVHAHAFSASAMQALKQCGGEATVVKEG